MSGTLILDTECYENFWYLGIKRKEDGKRVGFEYSERADFDRDQVRRIMRRYKTVGFHSIPYDLPMIYMALDGASNAELKEASNRLIGERIPYWKAEEVLGISIPWKHLDHIDIFETNPSVKRGLKSLNASMHHKRLQELPFHHTKILTHEDMDQLIEYCQYGDIDGTEMLFDVLQEPIFLREALREKYNTVDLRSKSDAQVGETILKTEVERRKDDRIKKAVIPDGTTFRYEPPEWISFKTPYMQEVFETVKNTDIEVNGGAVDFPKAFSKFNIVFDGMKHTLGLGGLHSTESNRAVHSDADSVLIDADVASQYPRIILNLGLFPKAMGADFLPVYKSIIDARLAAKKAKDKTTDKGLKIAINGSYGKLGSGYSVLFAPHLMIAVTLTGQLSLLMLIEAASLAGIPVVSANTDGVLFKCPRSMFSGLTGDRLNPSPIQDIIEWWEGLSGFNLEFGEYRAVYSQSVNSYMAIKPDGSFKRKGKLANHWRKELPWGGDNCDYDPSREGLKKSPDMTICADAALGMILHNIPPEVTVNQCRDVREFIGVISASKGATWGPGAPIYKDTERTTPTGKLVKGRALVGYEGEYYLGTLVRFYWAKDGNPIIRKEPDERTGNRAKVPDTDGSRPLMTLPDDYSVPADLDRQRYIDEAYRILKDIGYTGQASVTIWERILEILRS